TKLYKMMIKGEYDLVVSYLEGPATRIISGCPNKHSKLLNWVHTEINNPKELTKSYRSIKELVKSYNSYDATIFVSNTARAAFERTFKGIDGSMLVKYNTVDTQHITLKSKEQIRDIEISSNRINLISVGRFTEQKGYTRLIKIMQLLLDNKLNIHLYLLGKGELESKFREVISEERLNDYVTILGYKDNPFKYVKKCDLFVCSSYKEGYSTAVTESLIVGTPVVTTFCSGMEEMLGPNNEYGLITENSDESLYEGIKRMLTEPGLLAYYKQKAEERGKTFSTKKTVKDVEELIDNLLSEN
ncbi:glycosyltransferase, partial [Bacillus sp. MUM 13]|uniref:glycosyltransferase n=1 Tax=Bacillus sp. MUM 13 TaxID=1678001 RepID=UPI0008F5A23E